MQKMRHHLFRTSFAMSITLLLLVTAKINIAGTRFRNRGHSNQVDILCYLACIGILHIKAAMFKFNV